MGVDDLWQHQPPVSVVAPAGSGPAVGEVLDLRLQVEICRVRDRAESAEFRQQMFLVAARTDRSCVGPAPDILQDLLVEIINNSLDDQTQVTVERLETYHMVPKYFQLIKVKLFLSQSSQFFGRKFFQALCVY